MSAPDDTVDALAGLAPDARRRLDAFAKAVDRVNVEDLPLYVARARQPRHRRAVETAELVAIESGLATTVDAARHALIEAVFREFGARQFRVWLGGEAMAPSLGPVDERLRIAASLGEAVTALVLGDRLDAADSSELLGLWPRLLDRP
ncbi:MAG: hypothetical protein QOF49_782 [Chloroflexota bacterium]|nr:hypothetical protein [Chloroflexota bacterium]